MFTTHRPTLTLQLHNFDLFRTCRTALLRGNWQDFNWDDTSRGPSAIAELLVFTAYKLQYVSNIQPLPNCSFTFRTDMSSVTQFSHLATVNLIASSCFWHWIKSFSSLANCPSLIHGRLLMCFTWFLHLAVVWLPLQCASEQRQRQPVW